MKVALYPSLFSNGLRLHFYRPVQDVLDYLGLASSQLHPNSCRILMSCYIVWRMVLGTVGDDYPDLRVVYTYDEQHQEEVWT